MSVPPAEQRTSRADRERDYQRAVLRTRAPVRATSRATLDRYRRNRHWRIFPKEFAFRVLGDLRGRRVLDLGCGSGELSTQLAAMGARVTGVDLSPELIAVARTRAELDGVAGSTEFLVADVEAAGVPGSGYDVVVAWQVLHHVSLAPALAAIRGALRPGGLLVTMEPVAFSRTLAALRDRVPLPKNAGPDERQLSRAELDRVLGMLEGAQVRYFRVLGRLQRVLLGAAPDRAPRWAWVLTAALHYVDRAVLRAPGAWRLAGSVVVVGRVAGAPRRADAA